MQSKELAVNARKQQARRQQQRGPLPSWRCPAPTRRQRRAACLAVGLYVAVATLEIVVIQLFALWAKLPPSAGGWRAAFLSRWRVRAAEKRVDGGRDLLAVPLTINASDAPAQPVG